MQKQLDETNKKCEHLFKIYYHLLKVISKLQNDFYIDFQDLINDSADDRAYIFYQEMGDLINNAYKTILSKKE